jgi:hypothetical protein
MGILDKLFGGTKASNTATIEATPSAPECIHAVLLPHWDAVDDIGKEDRAVYFVCEACQQRFSPAEAQALKDTMAKRLLEVTEAAPEAKPE